MKINSEIRNTLSNTTNAALALRADETERILRREANPSFRTAYKNPVHGGQEVDDPVETLEHALESDDDGPHLPPVHGALSTPALARSTADPLASAELYAIRRQMAREEADRLYTSRVKLSMKKATEDALSDIYHAGFES